MVDTNQHDNASTVNAQEKIQQVQSRFGAAAAAYVTSKVHASGEDLKWIVETLALSGNERVLDVATGAGHTAFAIAPHAATVVALDITQQMLQVAQQGAEERHLNNIEFLEGNAQALPSPDASFDVVVCRQAAHHFPDVRQAVHEWSRVLKPAGKLIVVDSMSPADAESDAFLHEIEILRDHSHVRNSSRSEWLTYVQAAGFTVTSVEETGIYLDIPSWTQRMRTPAPNVARIEQLMHDAPATIRQTLHLEQQQGAWGFTLPVILLAAVKG